MGVRVLLVDDTADVRAGIVQALHEHEDFELVGEASSVADVVELAAQVRPDVVLIDVALPDLAGRDVLSRVRRCCPHARVVVYNGHDDPWIARHAEATAPAGAATDYLLDLLGRVAADGPRTVRERFAKCPTSVKSARRFVQQQTHDWELARVCDDAALVVTELAANAVDHAQSDFEVRLALTTAALRVEVFDSGRGTPEPQPPRRDTERGRGLLLVSAMSASWGIEDLRADGKVVWAELALDPTG